MDQSANSVAWHHTRIQADCSDQGAPPCQGHTLCRSSCRGWPPQRSLVEEYFRADPGEGSEGRADRLVQLLSFPPHSHCSCHQTTSLGHYWKILRGSHLGHLAFVRHLQIMSSQLSLVICPLYCCLLSHYEVDLNRCNCLCFHLWLLPQCFPIIDCFRC